MVTLTATVARLDIQRAQHGRQGVCVVRWKQGEAFGAAALSWIALQLILGVHTGHRDCGLGQSHPALGPLVRCARFSHTLKRRFDVQVVVVDVPLF